MDPGVIKNFQHFYRWHVVENILTANEDKKVKIYLLQASRMYNRAWEKSDTIANCFKKARFTQRRNENGIRDQTLEDNDKEIIPAVEDFGDLTSSSVSYEEFVTMDDVDVCGE
ncbi:hypothetical protein PR048_018792 [Dryococelus australis]|uniref:Transposase n=1 Tax=Dryococelus australis TaxID=614101 RepID=A0ABQ9H1S0_9NEOP|nr:hypothetical protein PR048_018792 [Dryococelus australis]